MKAFILCFTSFLLLFSSLLTAETKIYHWVDKQGKNHFSDTADPKAVSEEIHVGNQNLLLNSVTKQIQAPPTKTQQEQQNAIIYQANITSPEDDSAIRSNDGTLDIQITTTPEKQNTQKLQLFLDGKALGEPQISTTIRALNIDRGSHQVQVQLLDENGNVLAKTQTVTVHLQRKSIGMNNANNNESNLK
ncbi:MAG: DUF4124 domain-containing protein [Psychromonas sp.]|nr:DUF4124 domain-containing protein [Psychromonas sp.]